MTLYVIPPVSVVDVNPLQWERQPDLKHPIVVAGFAGWNDAGDAATGAVRYLATQWNALSFASIDPEEFFDFTESRPTVSLNDGVTRKIEWPSNRFAAATIPEHDRDVVFLHGTEPQLKWRTFCQTVIECARALEASTVLTLGSLLADVPHTRPAHVMVSASDPKIAERVGGSRSQYEGPTGIVSVLHAACADAGIDSASLWVSVPHYVSQTPSPKGTLALVERTAQLLGVSVDVLDLKMASATYEQQVTDLIDDEDMMTYVSQLEENDDVEQARGDSLAAEAERFLRDHDD